MRAFRHGGELVIYTYAHDYISHAVIICYTPYVHAAAKEYGNTLLEHDHYGAFGLHINPPRWSCCNNKLREAKGCRKVVAPHTSTLPSPEMHSNDGTVIFSEGELSDIDEDIPGPFDQSFNSAPSSYFMTEDNSIS